MTAIPMTLSDHEGHFAVWNLPNSHTWGNIACIIYDVFICLLQASPNMIFPRAVQQLTRFQLAVCVARSLCDSWASCYNFQSSRFDLFVNFCNVKGESGKAKVDRNFVVSCHRLGYFTLISVSSPRCVEDNRKCIWVNTAAVALQAVLVFLLDWMFYLFFQANKLWWCLCPQFSHNFQSASFVVLVNPHIVKGERQNAEVDLRSAVSRHRLLRLYKCTCVWLNAVPAVGLQAVLTVTPVGYAEEKAVQSIKALTQRRIDHFSSALFAGIAQPLAVTCILTRTPTITVNFDLYDFDNLTWLGQGTTANQIARPTDWHTADRRKCNVNVNKLLKVA